MNRRRHSDGEGGYTLTELLIAISLMGIIAAATTSVVISMFGTQSQTIEMSDIMAEARAGLVRTQTELRETKRLYPEVDPTAPCDPRELTLWVDDNRDGLLQSEEQITYALVPVNSHIATLRRWTAADPGNRQTIARRVANEDIFTCSPTPPDTRIIDIELTIVGDRGIDTTELDGSVRLRNVD